MKIRDFPYEMSKYFGNQNIIQGSFIDPCNHPSMGVVFVDQNGKTLNNPNNPDSCQFWKPLAGQFFDLELHSLILQENKFKPIRRIGRKKAFFVVGKDKNGVLYTSETMIAVNASSKSVNDFSKKHGIQWYGFNPKSSLYCVFSDFKSYTDFLKEAYEVQPKTG